MIMSPIFCSALTECHRLGHSWCLIDKPNASHHLYLRPIRAEGLKDYVYVRIIFPLVMDKAVEELDIIGHSSYQE
jgi:hypothetical protein